MNKPYNAKERAAQLEQKASDAWQAVAELHNQDEMTESEKKELKAIARKLAKIERKFMDRKINLEKKENEKMEKVQNELEYIIREHTAGGTRNVYNPYYHKIKKQDLAEYTARHYGRIGAWIEIIEVNDDFSYCKTVATFNL